MTKKKVRFSCHMTYYPPDEIPAGYKMPTEASLSRMIKKALDQAVRGFGFFVMGDVIEMEIKNGTGGSSPHQSPTP